jgi:pilus assembly protein TadC
MSVIKQKLEVLKKILDAEKKYIYEREILINNIASVSSLEERNLVLGKIKELTKKIHDLNSKFRENLEKIHQRGSFSGVEAPKEKFFGTKGGKLFAKEDLRPDELEHVLLKRIHRGENDKDKKGKKKVQEKSEYAKIAYKTFSKMARDLLGKKSFQIMERDLIKANLNFTPLGYISIILFTTMISGIVGAFIFLFFLFFNLSSTMPLISRAVESIDIRFLKVIWILFLVPIATFLLMYIYPKMEKKSREQLIEMELPFATIHMSAIAGSLISPIKIFEIIVSTNEYPHLQKEFTKMINEVNLYGSDLVSALKNTARNNPSKRLSELLNGLATTINSGGDLPKFFDKRSETLLFEYKLTKDKQNKAAETFMDIYISVVIAAPMILMLLLMIMKISGLGMSASIGTITLMMVVGVAIVNIGFLSFLNLKRKVV